jgi:hypothetical protein
MPQIRLLNLELGFSLFGWQRDAADARFASTGSVK